jgi:hypothetical protein
MAADFQDIDKGYSGVLDRIFEANNSFVEIGWFENEESKNKRNDPEGKPVIPKNVDIAIWNEFGTTRNGEQHIPERSFVRSSHDENLKRTSKLIEREYGRIVDGQSTAKRSLGLIGLFVESYTKRKIVTLRDPPNAPQTIRKKKSDNPLVDTKQMGNSIVSKVTIKRE